MRTRDSIVPADDLLTLLMRRARVTDLPPDRLGRIAATLRLMGAAVRVIAEATACLTSWDTYLLGQGFVTVACHRCSQRSISTPGGQQRTYCGDACRQAAHRERDAAAGGDPAVTLAPGSLAAAAA